LGYLNEGNVASKSDLVLLRILDTTNTLKLKGAKRKCYLSKDKCWPALSLFAQIRCFKNPYLEDSTDKMSPDNSNFNVQKH